MGGRWSVELNGRPLRRSGGATVTFPTRDAAERYVSSLPGAGYCACTESHAVLAGRLAACGFGMLPRSDAARQFPVYVSPPDADVWVYQGSRDDGRRFGMLVLVHRDGSDPNLSLSDTHVKEEDTYAVLPHATAAAVAEALVGHADLDAWGEALSCPDGGVAVLVRRAATTPEAPDAVRSLAALS